MHKSLYLTFCVLVISCIATAQIQKRRLPQKINLPTYSHIFPTVSGDGSQMIFLTNYTNSEKFETKYTRRDEAGVWSDPILIPSINRPGLDHIGSFCLSYDGNYVVFSSRRSPGIGNYDIWISEKNGNSWSQPQNLGKPLNSPGNEGNPSLSPDGKSIYFMRCEQMDIEKKRICQLYVSHRVSPTRWSEPEPLPNHINTGKESSPRILSDSKSLVFASGRSGGKGMLDLYMTKLEEDTWSQPKALSFINTNQNDEYVSIPARGDIIYYSGVYKDQYQIYQGIIPEEFRASKVMMLTGTVAYNDNMKPSDDVLVQAFDLSTGIVFTSTRLNKGDQSFSIFLPEGSLYDVSVFPQNGNHTYYSQIYDLTNMHISRKEEISVSLSALAQGVSMPLSTIRFEDYSAILAQDSNIEIKRILGFLKKNSGVRLEIGAYVDTVFTDSIQTNDLTEVIVDTVFFEIQKESKLRKGKSKKKDSDDSLLENDSINDVDDNNIVASDSMNIEILSPGDSIRALGFELFEETKTIEIYIKLNNTYHNDRTQQQAEALMNKLIAAGVPDNLLEAVGYGDDWEEDRAVEERNYWIELKILKE
jgi:hypothetical protein